MRSAGFAVALAVTLVSCGGHPPPVQDPEGSGESGPFVESRGFKPTTFAAEVTGHGRPVIFIPGLGCPGAVWADTVAHLGGTVEAHVLTLAGFAGQPPIKPPLASKVRKELVRYIRTHKLVAPIIVGHSMGGFIAYWLAATAPDLIGGVIVVDAGPALSDNDVETANTLRNSWAQSGDDELPQQVKAAYGSMVSDPKRIEPFLDAITKSDRHAIGDAIYELVRTDVTDQLHAITAPLLLILADGGYQQRYRTQADPVPHHEVAVVTRARHFVMLDDPKAFFALIDKFLADHPAK